MTDGNEVYKTVTQGLNNLVLSDTDDNKEEQDSVLLYAEPVSIVLRGNNFH